MRTVHQEKKLRKRRELDALVREGGGRRRKTGGREELLYRDEETSSEDSGQGRVEEGVGVTVWRPQPYPNLSHSRRRGVMWLGVRWGLAMVLVIFLGSVTTWLHLHTRREIEMVRIEMSRVKDNYKQLPLNFQQSEVFREHEDVKNKLFEFDPIRSVGLKGIAS